MAGGVPISCVERRDQRPSKLEVGTFESLVRRRKICGETALLLVEAVEPLRGHGWNEEQRERPRRDLRVHECEQTDNRCIERGNEQQERGERVRDVSNRSPTHGSGHHVEGRVDYFTDERADECGGDQASELRSDQRDRRLRC